MRAYRALTKSSYIAENPVSNLVDNPTEQLH